jgi:hypothetical protein
MATQNRSKNRPEKKISPVNSGLSVAIWLNTVETDDGNRQYRSITISGKRYRDRKSGEWKDSGAYVPADLPALVFSLEQAIAYCYSTPLPGQTSEPGAEAHPRQPDDDEVPY